MMKKVLVTGGTGFIGSNLIKVLLKLNYRLTSLDNNSTGNKKNEFVGVEYIEDDITNIDKLDNDFDVCFHLAAQSRVQPSFDNPEESFRVNVFGTSKVMEWAKQNNIKVVYAGSSSKHHNPSDSPYAMYKFLGEEVCKLYKNSFNVNVEISRFYNVYGPGENIDEKFGNVIGIWSAKIKKNQRIPIVGDGEQKRDFIHVLDLVNGLIKIAESSVVHDDAWELGTGVNYSVNELFNFFSKKYDIEPIYIPDQPGNYRETLRINDDAIKLLKWKPNDRLKNHIKNLNL
jgi:UDP-glucose 4-epimerase